MIAKILLLVLFFVLNVSWTRLGPNGGTFFNLIFLNGSTVVAGGDEYSASYLTNNGGKSWKKISQGGVIRALRTPGYLLKFNSLGEISLSKDNGVNWEKRTEIQPPGADLLDVGVSNSGELCALVLDGNALRFYLSNDLGDTWLNKSTVTASFDLYYTKMVVSDNTIYAVVGSKIFLSENLGSSWKKLGKNGLPCCPIVSSLDIDRSNAKTLYICTKVGIFKSTNGGNSWQKVRNGHFTSLSVHPRESGTLYAIGPRPRNSTVPVAIKTKDAGKSWTSLQLPSRDFTEVAVNPFMPHNVFLAAVEYGILKSENDGASWTTANSGLNSLNLYQLQLSPKGFLARGERSLFFSTDAKKWQNTTGEQFNKAIHIVSNKNASIAQTCCPTKLLVSYDGLNWQTLYTGEQPSFIAVDAKKSRTFYKFSEYSGMKTDDSGHTWKPIFIKGIKFHGLNYITALSVGNEAENLLIGTFDGTFYRSTDAGKSWKKSMPGGREIFEIINDPKNANIIYVATIVGESSIEKRAALFRTSDAGNTWEKISDPSPGALRINPANTSEIVAVNPTLLISADSGRTWNNFRPDLNSVDAIYDFVFEPKNPQKVFVATSNGIFSSLH